MIKEEYKDIPDTEFVLLKEGIDPVFWDKYEINKDGEIRHVKKMAFDLFIKMVII